MLSAQDAQDAPQTAREAQIAEIARTLMRDREFNVDEFDANVEALRRDLLDHYRKSRVVRPLDKVTRIHQIQIRNELADRLESYQSLLGNRLTLRMYEEIADAQDYLNDAESSMEALPAIPSSQDEDDETPLNEEEEERLAILQEAEEQRRQEQSDRALQQKLEKDRKEELRLARIELQQEEEMERRRRGGQDDDDDEPYWIKEHPLLVRTTIGRNGRVDLDFGVVGRYRAIGYTWDDIAFHCQTSTSTVMHRVKEAKRNGWVDPKAKEEALEEAEKNGQRSTRDPDTASIPKPQTTMTQIRSWRFSQRQDRLIFPRKVRSDRGSENALVAEFMEKLHGPGSHLLGDPVHNTKVGRHNQQITVHRHKPEMIWIRARRPQQGRNDRLGQSGSRDRSRSPVSAQEGIDWANEVFQQIDMPGVEPPISEEQIRVLEREMAGFGDETTSNRGINSFVRARELTLQFINEDQDDDS
ncbi:hypothetical protein HDU76_003783 [Blyttiomyces sp. JEL0837]|nr:hypothetical protein HDU76_003783 [Blyttiomyces sp. JEL0837]